MGIKMEKIVENKNNGKAGSFFLRYGVKTWVQAVSCQKPVLCNW